MQKYVNASSKDLSVVSHVILIWRQHASSLTTASSSLISLSHCSISFLDSISLFDKFLKYGSNVSHVVTLNSSVTKCLSVFFISAVNCISAYILFVTDEPN